MRTRYEGFKGVIKAVGTGKRGSRDLTFDEARDATRALLAGEVSDAQAGAFLLSLRMKGEAASELGGMAQALRDAALPIAADGDRPLVACAGAFDGVAEAPHLSLAAAVAAAACGAAVIVSCGDRLGPKYGLTPAEVLGALGGDERPGPDASAAMLARSGVALVHLGESLPGWSRLAELRDEIGLRGPLHSAEKLVDWAGARRFVVGHTHSGYTDRLLGALDAMDAEAAIAVRGIEGSDVARPGRPSAFDARGRLDLPERLGEQLEGDADAEASARLTRAVLAGEENGTAAWTIDLNAGLRLFAAGVVGDPLEGAALARRAIDEGRASATLDALVG